MNILLNETIEEPGVYMQEFPYPCYVKDKWVYRNLQVIIDCRRCFSLESHRNTGKYHSEVTRVLWFKKKKKRIKWKTLALCFVKRSVIINCAIVVEEWKAEGGLVLIKTRLNPSLPRFFTPLRFANWTPGRGSLFSDLSHMIAVSLSLGKSETWYLVQCFLWPL